MLEKAFELAVIISAIDHFSGPSKKIAAQMGIVSKQAAELQKRVDAFKGMAYVGGVVTAAGGAVADGLYKAAEKAGEFQTKLITIQGITGATTSQMNKLSNAIMNTSSQVTMFNDMQLGGFAQQLASGGFKSIKDVQRLLLPVSQFAEVQQYEGKADSSSAVNMAINMAHLFKHYDTASMKKYLDTFNKYSVMEPGSSEDLYQTLSYLAPTAYRQFHMRETDVMSLAAIANRVGLRGSHGGTNAADMILRLVPGMIGGTPTATKNPKAWDAMLKLGLINQKGQSKFFKNGHITDLQTMIQTLIDASKKYSTPELAKYYHDIFGIQGGRAASILSDQSTVDQLKSMQAQLQTTKSIQQMMDAYQKSTEGQINMLKSNSLTVILRFAMQLMPVLNPVLSRLNGIVKAFMKFEEAHPKIMKYVATFLSIAAGVMLVVGPLMLLTGIIGYLFTSSAISTGAQLLMRSFTGMLGPVSLLIGAGYLLYQAWIHDWGGIREKASSALSWIRQELPVVEERIGSVASALGFIKAGQFHVPTWLKWGAGLLLGIKGLTGLFSALNMILGPFAALTRFVGSGGAILRGMMSFVSLIMRITGLTRLWTAVQMALNIVMDMNPIGLMVIGIATLVAVVILAITHWQTIIGWLKQAWNWFKNLHGVVQTVSLVLQGFAGLPGYIIANWKPIETFFSTLWTKYIKPVMDAVGKWGGGALKGVEHFFGFGGGSSSSDVSGAMGSYGSSSSTVNIHPGAIQINGSSDPKSTANEVMKQLGLKTRSNNLSRPFGPNRQVFGN